MPLCRALIVCLSLTTFASAAELKTLKGKTHTGDLVSIDAQAVVLKTADGEVSTPLPEILTLSLKDAPAKLPEKFSDVELVDGTLFHCAKVALNAKQAILDFPSGMKLTLNLTSVVSILSEAQDPALRKEFGAIVSERARSDRFFVRKEGRLDGREGTFGDAAADGKTIAFTDKSGEKLNLPLDRLAALLFNNRLEGNIPPTACRISDVNKTSSSRKRRC